MGRVKDKLLLGPEIPARQDLGACHFFELAHTPHTQILEPRLPHQQKGANDNTCFTGLLESSNKRSGEGRRITTINFEQPRLWSPVFPSSLHTLPPCPSQLGNGPSWMPGCFPWPGSHSRSCACWMVARGGTLCTGENRLPVEAGGPGGDAWLTSPVKETQPLGPPQKAGRTVPSHLQAEKAFTSGTQPLRKHPQLK